MKESTADQSKKTEEVCSDGTIAVSVSVDTSQPTDRKQLGPFLVGAELGRGAMGAVYEAVHTRLKRTVALKILPPEFGLNPARLGRFQREMEAIGRLDHPHIVRATDAGDVEGTHYIAMEMVDGIDLEQLIHLHGSVSIGIACEFIRQAALGLQHIHENELVHRDIKPSNLIVTKTGVVKILDLGIARLHQGEELSTLTSFGGLMGTPDYMAPEQITDSGCVDIRADIYSLGCTLYNLIAGRAPFGGPKYGTRVAKIVAHTTEEAEPLVDCPTELSTIVGKMMSKDPNERYSTPADVANALAPWAEGVEVTSYLADIGRSRVDRSIEVPCPSGPCLTKKQIRRLPLHRWFLCVAAVIGGLLLLLLSRSDPVTDPPAADDVRLATARGTNGHPELAGPLREVAANTKGIHEATEALVVASTEINENTGRIVESLEELREEFQRATHAGSIVTNADTIGELYHNALVYARQGKHVLSHECFLRILQAGTDFIDVHASFQATLILREGIARARELYQSQSNFAFDASVRKWSLAMLADPINKQALLEELVATDPDFAPGIYALAQFFSESHLGTQTLADQARERKLLQGFLAAHRNGGLLRYFLDQSQATIWIEDANRRLAMLQGVSSAIYDDPVTTIFQRHSGGWNVIFQIAEPARELFFRRRREDDFESTGLSQSIDPRTGYLMPKGYVTLPANTAAGEFEVKYTDQHGQQRGPFRIVFEPAIEEIENHKRALELSKHSWLQFGTGQQRETLSFSRLAAHGKTIREVRYGIETAMPDKIHELPDLNAGGKLNRLSVPISEDASFVSIQLVFADGTTSDVVRIERRDE
jgi:serine/threonine protein kinase